MDPVSKNDSVGHAAFGEGHEVVLAPRDAAVSGGRTGVAPSRQRHHGLQDRLAEALRSLHARLRGASADVAFLLDGRTLEAGDHFTFATDAGPMDCLGTPAGTDGFADLDASATDEDLDALVVRVASLDDLIRMKRAADRPQDRIAVEWLSALRDELES